MEKPVAQRVKDVWSSLFSSKPVGEEETTGQTKFTPERLQALYETLHRHPVINDGNKAVVVETIRSIAEFMIWGDQHEPRIFDFFLEHNIVVYLLGILQQPDSCKGDVAKQVLQTLSIIIQNVRSETGILFLFSNNHINNIVSSNFDFEDEEVLGYYISFLKAISLKLNPLTVRFFLLRAPTLASPTTTPSLTSTPDGASTSTTDVEGLRFPLYTEALKFAHHKEGMVRAGVRTLTLNVYSVPDASIQAFVSTSSSVKYFAEVADYLKRQFEILSASMSAAEGYGQQALSQLDSQIAEVEDMLSYCNDVFSTAHPYTSHMLAQALWQRLAGPYWFKPLILQTTPHAGSTDTALIKLQASFYTLERVFQLITYTPLLNNILLALLARSPIPSNYYPSTSSQAAMQPWTLTADAATAASPLSCRQALLSLLSMHTPLAAPAAVRMLVAITQCRALPPGILASLDLQPHTPPTSASATSSSGAHELSSQLAAERCGSHRPSVFTPVLTSPAFSLGYGYYSVWSETQPPCLLQPDMKTKVPADERAADKGQLQGSASLRCKQMEEQQQELEAQARHEEEAAEQQPQREQGEWEQQLAVQRQQQEAEEQQQKEKQLGSEQQLAVQGQQQEAEEQQQKEQQIGSKQQPESARQQQEAEEQQQEEQQLEAARQQLEAEEQRQKEQQLGSEQQLAAARQHQQQEAEEQQQTERQSEREQQLALGGKPEEMDDQELGERQQQEQMQHSQRQPQGILPYSDDLLDLGSSCVALQSSVQQVVPAATSMGGDLLGGVAMADSEAFRASVSGSTSQSPAPTEADFQGPGDATHQPATRARVKPNMTVATSGSELDGPSSFQQHVLLLGDMGSMVDDLVEGVVRAHLGNDGTHSSQSRYSSLGGYSMDGAPQGVERGSMDNGATGGQSPWGAPPGPHTFAPEMSANQQSNPADDRESSTAENDGACPSKQVASNVGETAERGDAADEAGASEERVVGSRASVAAQQGAEDRAESSTAEVPEQGQQPPPPPPPEPPQPSPPPPQPLASQPAQPAAADLVDAVLGLVAAPHLPPWVLWHAAVLLRTWLGTHALPLRLQHPYAQSNQQQSPPATSVPDTPTKGASGSDDPLARQWACTLSHKQRQALAAAIQAAVAAAFAELDGMWCEAFFTLLCLEWPVAGQAIRRPVLRAMSDVLMGGPHLHPPVQATSRQHGMGLSAAAALQMHLSLQRLVGLLQLLRVMHKGESSMEPPVPHLHDLKLRQLDVTEGQQVPMTQDNAIQCQVSFQPSQEKRVYFTVTGIALPSAVELLSHAAPALPGSTPPPGATEVTAVSPLAAATGGAPIVLEADSIRSTAALNVMHSSPAIVLGEASATRLNTGVVVSTAPLLGGAPYVDPNVPRWLHVHVRPSVRGLLRLMHEAQARKGGLLYTLRSLADGHWVLAFQNGDRCREAHNMVQQQAVLLRGLYKQLAHGFVSPLLGTLDHNKM